MTHISTAIPRSASEDGVKPHRLMCAQKESKASVEMLRKLEEQMLVMDGARDGINMFNRAVDEEIQLHETE